MRLCSRDFRRDQIGKMCMHGKRTSIAWKTKELSQVSIVSACPLAFDFQRPFAGIASQHR